MDKILAALFTEEGALLRVRGLGTLALIGGFIYLAVTGVVSPEVYVAVLSGFGGAYMGSRIAQSAAAGATTNVVNTAAEPPAAPAAITYP